MSPLRAAEVFEPARPIKIRERRSPSLTMIVVLVLLAIIGYAAYRLVSDHGKPGHLAAAASNSGPPSLKPTSAARTSPVPSATPSDLVIKVDAGQEGCWVLLTRTSDGSQIYMGVVSAGTSMTWTEKQPVSLRLGNPGGIVLTVDGQRRQISTVLPVTLNFSPPGSSAASPSADGSSGSQSG